MRWGDRYLSDAPPRLVRRKSDGSPVVVAPVASDGTILRAREIETVPGPGAA